MTVAEANTGERFVCRNFSAPDIAVDLGTATLRICSTASDVMERSSEITVGSSRSRHPMMRGGVIVDCDAATHLLRGAFQALRSWHARRPRVLATVPGDANDEERATLVSALYRAGAGLVALLPEPVAAAVGAGLADATPSVHMIVDVGEGVTEVAVLSRGALLYRASIRLACADARECMQAAALRLGVPLSRPEADAILFADDSGLRDEVAPGFDRSAAAPATDTIAAFIAHVYRHLDRREQQIIAREGVCLTGGGALIRELHRALVSHFQLRVRVPADPLKAVISGARKLLHGEAAHVWAGFADA